MTQEDILGQHGGSADLRTSLRAIVVSLAVTSTAFMAMLLFVAS